MRCVHLIDEQGTRCPHRAYRGKNYCGAHGPSMDVHAVRKDAADLVGASAGDEYIAAQILFAWIEPNIPNENLAEFLKLDRDKVETVLGRLRENRIISGDTLCVDEEVDMNNVHEVNVMFILFALCGAGKVQRDP